MGGSTEGEQITSRVPSFSDLAQQKNLPFPAFLCFRKCGVFELNLIFIGNTFPDSGKRIGIWQAEKMVSQADTENCHIDPETLHLSSVYGSAAVHFGRATSRQLGQTPETNPLSRPDAIPLEHSITVASFAARHDGEEM